MEAEVLTEVDEDVVEGGPDDEVTRPAFREDNVEALVSVIFVVLWVFEGRTARKLVFGADLLGTAVNGAGVELEGKFTSSNRASIEDFRLASFILILLSTASLLFRVSM